MPLSAAAAGLIGTGISSALNYASQAKVNAQNKKMAEDAYRKQAEAVQRMNEYNSPSMQVARLKAAGLSPSLAYGANGETTGQQSEIPEFNPIPAEAPQVNNFGSAFTDAARLGLEMREQENRDKLAVADLALKDANSFFLIMAGNHDKVLTEKVIEMLPYDIEKAASEINLNYENIEKIRKEMQEIEQNIAESASRIGLNEAQVRELASRTNLNEAEVIRIYKLLPYEVQKMDSEAFLNWAKGKEAYKTMEYIGAQCSDMAFYRNLNERKFGFEKDKFMDEAAMWMKDYRKDVMNNLGRNFTQIISIGAGAAMMKKGESLPPQRKASPVITPSGGSMFGQNWNQ